MSNFEAAVTFKAPKDINWTKPMSKRKAKRILFWHNLLSCHFFWRMRNSYSRVCKVCKRQDDQYTMTEGNCFSWIGRSWWETMYYGKHGEKIKERS